MATSPRPAPGSLPPDGGPGGRLHIHGIKEMPAGYDAEVAELFRDLRSASGLTEADLAAQLATRPRWCRRWSRARSMPCRRGPRPTAWWRPTAPCSISTCGRCSGASMPRSTQASSGSRRNRCLTCPSWRRPKTSSANTKARRPKQGPRPASASPPPQQPAPPQQRAPQSAPDRRAPPRPPQSPQSPQMRPQSQPQAQPSQQPQQPPPPQWPPQQRGAPPAPSRTPPQPPPLPRPSQAVPPREAKAPAGPQLPQAKPALPPRAAPLPLEDKPAEEGLAVEGDH